MNDNNSVWPPNRNDKSRAPEPNRNHRESYNKYESSKALAFVVGFTSYVIWGLLIWYLLLFSMHDYIRQVHATSLEGHVVFILGWLTPMIPACFVFMNKHRPRSVRIYTALGNIAGLILVVFILAFIAYAFSAI